MKVWRQSYINPGGWLDAPSVNPLKYSTGEEGEILAFCSTEDGDILEAYYRTDSGLYKRYNLTHESNSDHQPKRRRG